MDLIQRMKKLLGTEHPYDKAHRLKVECTDGITLTRQIRHRRRRTGQ